VVVVELAGTAGVVVVLVVVVGVAQPDSDAMATAAKHARIIFFISIIFVWFVVLQAQNYVISLSNAMGCNPTSYSSSITANVSDRAQCAIAIPTGFHPKAAGRFNPFRVDDICGTFTQGSACGTTLG